MSKTTGIVLATGGITIANLTVFHGQPMNWRIPIATGLTAIGFSLAERVWPTGAVLMAWTGFLSVMLSRVDPNVPSPVESAVEFYNASERKPK